MRAIRKLHARASGKFATLASAASRRGASAAAPAYTFAVTDTGNAGRATRWYFGWNIVAAASLLTLLTVGMRLGTGPFFLPMAHDLGFSQQAAAEREALQ